MRRREGQKNTLVVHDPCPGYIPPVQRARDEVNASHQQRLTPHQQQHFQCQDNYCDMDQDLDVNMMQEGEGPSVENFQEEIGQIKEGCSHEHNTTAPPTNDNNLPLVVLDCANIGWAFGMDSFNSEGVQAAFQFFEESFRANVLGFLPASYYTRRPKDGGRGNALEHTPAWGILDSLVRSGQLVIVPAGDPDDLYILQYARMHQGFVVSNDFFADHIGSLPEEEQEAAHEWLRQVRCSYTFVKREQKGGFMPSPASAMMSVLESHRKERGDDGDVGDDMEMEM